MIEILQRKRIRSESEQSDLKLPEVEFDRRNLKRMIKNC